MAIKVWTKVTFDFYLECLGPCCDASSGHVSVITACTPLPQCLPVHTDRAQATLVVTRKHNLLQGLLASPLRCLVYSKLHISCKNGLSLSTVQQ